MRSSMTDSRKNPPFNAVVLNFRMHHFISKIPNPRLKVAGLSAYYAIIIAAVIYVQLRANFASPAFVYQAF